MHDLKTHDHGRAFETQSESHLFRIRRTDGLRRDGLESGVVCSARCIYVRTALNDVLVIVGRTGIWGSLKKRGAMPMAPLPGRRLGFVVFDFARRTGESCVCALSCSRAIIPYTALPFTKYQI